MTSPHQIATLKGRAWVTATEVGEEHSMRVHRVLDPQPVRRLQDHLDAGGGRALELGRAAAPGAILSAIEASGLRGRGGGGFPTATKWRTVAENQAGASPATVVVNAAEGEPGSYKDRAILLSNPYRVIEGALVAAGIVGADRIVIAVKASAAELQGRIADAVREVAAAGWVQSVDITVATGPDDYLFGEETALLEVLAGRQPFPRLSPPYRHGVDEDPQEDGTAAAAKMASPSVATEAAPTLVNNVETFANVPGIVVEGPEWFREVGTDASPGTIVCTVSGDCPTEGVGEFAMGTTLETVLRELGGVSDPQSQVGFVLSGVANPLLPADLLGTALDYEAMRDAGGGLGTGGFLVFGPDRDPVSVIGGVSRFLGVESCGQCTPCKQDGVALAELLEGVRAGTPEPDAVEQVAARARTVSNEARCYLATQHELVVSSLLEHFPDRVLAEAAPNPSPDRAAPVLIAAISGWDGERFVLDTRQADKHPDWTYGGKDSGKSPAERIDQQAGEG